MLFTWTFKTGGGLSTNVVTAEGDTVPEALQKVSEEYEFLWGVLRRMSGPEPEPAVAYTQVKHPSAYFWDAGQYSFLCVEASEEEAHKKYTMFLNAEGADLSYAEKRPKVVHSGQHRGWENK